MCRPKQGSLRTPVAVGAVVLAGALVTSAAAVITDVLTAVLVCLGVLCAAGAAGFVVLLRSGAPALSAPESLGPGAATRSPALGAGSLAAIEPRRAVPGVVLTDETAERR